MIIETRPFDPAEYLSTEEGMVAYLDEALLSGDPAFVADALGVIARARGMSELARKAKLSRESLYRALSKEGNPSLATIMQVLKALNLHLAARSDRLTSEQSTSRALRRPAAKRATRRKAGTKGEPQFEHALP